MNLEDLKKEWNNIGESSGGEMLSEKEIKNIISKRNRTTRIKGLIPESLFVLIYLYLIVFLAAFNSTFKLPSLRILTFICIGILVVQCFTIISTSRIFNRSSKLLGPYKNTILNLKEECEKLNKRYYLIIIFSAIILICCIILLPKVYTESPSLSQTLISTVIGLCILAFVKFKIYKFYKKLIKKNNRIKILLKDNFETT